MSKTGFAYGAVIRFNLVQNVAITVGYEGATFNSIDDSRNVNPNRFNVSVGYSF
ncbi:outer membrane beta-barrel protein [Salmonella enterica]|nr:outer membrane beta-barrel protein [Salmonella enterica]